MDGFREIFEEYGGDYEETMARFLGKREMYLRFLSKLFADDESFVRLGRALEDGDAKAAFEAAHTLKGVVGNMGLTPLYQAISAIVEPLRAGKDPGGCRELYEAVRSEYRKAERLKDELGNAR